LFHRRSDALRRDVGSDPLQHKAEKASHAIGHAPCGRSDMRRISTQS
jgi:hypothetical protein